MRLFITCTFMHFISAMIMARCVVLLSTIYKSFGQLLGSVFSVLLLYPLPPLSCRWFKNVSTLVSLGSSVSTNQLFPLIIFSPLLLLLFHLLLLANDQIILVLFLLPSYRSCFPPHFFIFLLFHPDHVIFPHSD